MTAHVAQPRSSRPDDDRLLAVALDVDLGPNVDQGTFRRPARARAHLLDDDRDRVRELVAYALEGGLADELGDEAFLRLVAELPVRVQRRALGQGRDQ